jgi:hypothetical protein
VKRSKQYEIRKAEGAISQPQAFAMLLILEKSNPPAKPFEEQIRERDEYRRDADDHLHESG